MSDTDMGIQLPPEQAGKVAAWQAEIDEKRNAMLKLIQHLVLGDAREVRKALNALPAAAEDYAITRLVHQELMVNTYLMHGKPGPVKVG